MEIETFLTTCHDYVDKILKKKERQAHEMSSNAACEAQQVQTRYVKDGHPLPC